LDNQSDGKPSPAAGRIPLFSVRGLTKSFGEHRALDGIDLDIYEGECLLVAGANGSGKTVLMKIIACLMEASAGTVLYRGEPLGGKANARKKLLEALRRELGLVFQDPDAQFVGETVAEDAAFGPQNLGVKGAELERRVNSALAKTGLLEKREWAPRELSGGEKRRLAIAGILAMEQNVIIMDEPFANLDWPGVVQVLESVRELKSAGKTLIILTHELEKVLAFADRLLILDRGRVKEDGPPEEVLNRLKTEYGVRDPRHSCQSVEDCTWLN
jgi:biotin transport system ATP-binding protein